MSKRRDQLPPTAIKDHLGNEDLLIEYGVAWADDVARLFLLALQGEPREFEMEMLVEHIKEVVERRDVPAFEHLLWAFRAVVKRLERGTYSVRRNLTDKFMREPERYGEKRASGAGLCRFLNFVLGKESSTSSSRARALRREWLAQQ